MTTRVLLITVLLAAGLWAAHPSGDQARGSQGGPACTITAWPLVFGVYRVFDAQALDSTAEIRVECRSQQFIRVTLGPGVFGSYLDRRMTSDRTQDELRYQVYQDQSRQLIFGSGLGGTSNFQATVPMGIRTISLFGRIFPGQMVQAGNYGDGLYATLSF
jgi:spore coat protein U-like protein